MECLSRGFNQKLMNSPCSRGRKPSNKGPYVPLTVPRVTSIRQMIVYKLHKILAHCFDRNCRKGRQDCRTYYRMKSKRKVFPSSKLSTILSFLKRILEELRCSFMILKRIASCESAMHQLPNNSRDSCFNLILAGKSFRLLNNVWHGVCFILIHH